MSEGEAVTRQWLLVGALALAPAVSNGFARFAYGLILPAMRIDLGWNYTQAGWINTANALGYLIGALLALTLISRVGSRRMFAAGMLLTGLSLLLSGLTGDFVYLTLWRILAGVGGAPAFIAGGAMVSAVFRGQPRQTALAIALYFGGGGIGMLISGATIPLVLDGAADRWPQIWVGMGVASLLTMGPVIWAVRSVSPVEAGPQAIRPDRLPWRAMSLELIAYFLFAVGYIVYLTFVVAWMREGQASAALIAGMWSLLGFMVMASPILWRGVLARYAGGPPMALHGHRRGDAAADPGARPAGRARLGVRLRGVLLHGTGIGHRVRAPQPARAPVGRVDRAVHEHLRGRPADRPGRGRLHLRPHRRSDARADDRRGDAGAGGGDGRLPEAAYGSMRMARKSLTLVRVGPVITRSPSASKKE